jgi:hypothetical protein
MAFLPAICVWIFVFLKPPPRLLSFPTLGRRHRPLVNRRAIDQDALTMGIGSVAGAFVAGVLTVLSPCVLPILPIVLSAAASERLAL